MSKFDRMAARVRVGRRGIVRGGGLIVLSIVALLGATACGGSSRTGTKIAWQAGTPGPDVAVRDTVPVSEPTAEQPTAADGTIAVVERPTPEEPATTAGSRATEPPAEGAGTTAPLSAAQLAELKPNELGVIPIMEYHQFVTDPKQKEQYIRPIQDFRKDLEWYYEHGFYIVPLRDVFLNRINAPAGKRAMVLTFDDSTAGQFRFLKTDDGGIAIDPNSAIGVLETFYNDHPDFGSGGHFAALPYQCFDWGVEAEPDQTEFCQQKLQWLLDHGYEIGNHTLNHADIGDVDDETFRAEVGGACVGLRELVPEAQCDILTYPFGAVPDPETHERQLDSLLAGFEYEGTEFTFLGGLLVGAEPAASPVSTDWDPLFTYRIQAYDGDAGLDTWLPIFEKFPDILYTSDGNPDTITVPDELPPDLDGTFDEAKAEADGKEVIRYDLPVASE